MALTKEQRQVEGDALLQEYLRDESAITLIYWLVDVFEHVDDVVDGDRDVGLKECSRLLDLVFVGIPSNPFYHRFRGPIAGALSVIINNWVTATNIELDARDAHNPDDPMLLRSYELRNGIFDLAPLAVSLLHGTERRDEFSPKWARVVRDYEDFGDYVKKVVAIERPNKEADNGESSGGS